MRYPNSGYNIDDPAFPLLQSGIAYWNTTSGNGNALGTTLVCADLDNHPTYAGRGNRVKIITGGAWGQDAEIMTHAAGGILTVAQPFTNAAGAAQQIVAGTLFVILSSTGGGGGAGPVAPSIGLWMFGICDPAMVASTTAIVCPNLAGFPDDIFNGEFWMQVIHNDDAPGTAPEREWRQITNYVGATGAFTTDAFSANVEANDLVTVVHESIVGMEILGFGTLDTSSATVPADSTRAAGYAWENDEYFKGCVLMPTEGACRFQPRPIRRYTNVTGVFTLDEPFSQVPGLVDYVILRSDYPIQRFDNTVQRSGITWYVNAATGGLVGGRSRSEPFDSWNTVLNFTGSGDRIVVAEGTYDEPVTIPAAMDGLEIICEPGVILTNSTPGTVVSIAADNVAIKGYPLITQAGQIGLAVSGDDFYGEVRIVGCTTSFDMNGARPRLRLCQSIAHTVTGFDISEPYGEYDRCNAFGTAATRGFYLSHTNAHANLLKKCSTLNCSAGGYECVAGADENVFDDCSQSELCGGPIDAGANNSWINHKEESQIAVANTLQQDLADIHTLASALATRALFSVDYWGDPQEEVQLTAAAGTKALPNVTVADLSLGTVVRAIAMFKFRMVENTNVAANKLDGATVAGTSQVIQVRDDTPGVWRDAINFVDDQFGIGAGPLREGGDVLIGSVDIAVEVDGNDTYNFQWLLAKADLGNIQFNDVQTGLRVWYQV